MHKFKPGDKIVADKKGIELGWGPIAKIGLITVVEWFTLEDDSYYRVRYRFSKTGQYDMDWLPLAIENHFRLATDVEIVLYGQ